MRRALAPSASKSRDSCRRDSSHCTRVKPTAATRAQARKEEDPAQRAARVDATRSAHRPRQLNKCGSGAVGRRTKRLNVGGILILLCIVRAELALLHLWRARRGPVRRPARRFFYVRVDGRSWRASVEASCMCRLHGLVALHELLTKTSLILGAVTGTQPYQDINFGITTCSRSPPARTARLRTGSRRRTHRA